MKNLKCKNFLIDFLDELGNFKQKTFYTSKCKFVLHFTTTDPIFALKENSSVNVLMDCYLTVSVLVLMFMFM